VGKYSGMMSYEKAAHELPYLVFMIKNPIVVAGGWLNGYRNKRRCRVFTEKQ
jgi:hypothetical protein